MVGLGETFDEVVEVMGNLADRRVDILTIGQYLQPSSKHLPIERYYLPEEFDRFIEVGKALGFKWVESGPLVRSSYRADQQVRALSQLNHIRVRDTAAVE
jgi:lipoic acid synthetase